MNCKLAIILKKSFLGLIITILSPLFTTYKVIKFENLSALKYGFPFGFIEQQSWLTPFEKDLPLRLHIGLPHENPTRFLVGNFILSLLTVIFILFFVSYTVGYVNKHILKK